MVDVTRSSFKMMLARMAKGSGLAAVAMLLGIGSANAFNVSVVNENGVAVTGFRWLLEEDTSFQVTPAVQTQNSVSLDFHKSYAPVLQSGECDTAVCTVTPADPTKVYTVSVLPYTGHNIGAAQVPVGALAVTAKVTTTPLPSAQIRVQLFHDNAPINGAIDAPLEDNPAADAAFDPTQFTVILEDSGGRYGHTGGQILQDVYGNPLGTTYDPLTNAVIALGNGVLTPDANGILTIKHIPPAKYGLFVVPPAGQGWVQTSTIEGTKVIDAWVKAKEPPFFTEFGPPGPHVFIGFVKSTNTLSGAGANISGTVVSNHLSRPPVVAFNPGAPVEDCWVGLNEGAGVGVPAKFVAPCTAGGNFNIPSVPAGTYTLTIWNTNLTIIIASYAINNTDPNTGAAVAMNLGNVLVFNWFARLENFVFSDTNENGFHDANEATIPEQAVNIRFRNGTIYQSFPTDSTGYVPFDTVFPFFHWLVAEVDFARYRATGVTYVVDAGGAIPPDFGWNTPSRDVLNPQAQPAINIYTGNNLSTTLEGPVLTLGMQAFLGSTNFIEWGKKPYGAGDADNAPFGNFPGPEDVDADFDGKFDPSNGGITGMVTYSVTRAEHDPRYAASEEWEPGLPRIQVNLYADSNDDNIVDDLNLDLAVTPADVDNYPLGNFPGAEDVDRNANLAFDYGDAVQVVWTDSWDDSVPTGCVGDVFVAHPGTPIAKTTDCYDGLRNYNQIREAVFDGGYAFWTRMERNANGTIVTDALGAPVQVEGIKAGYYITEVAVPKGFQLVKEEDKNVDFGVDYQPNPLLLPPICVGAGHLVPPYLSFQTSRVNTNPDGTPAPLAGIATADLIPSPFANTVRPLCDRKKVALTAGSNAAVNFNLFSDVPISANVIGGILNDLGNEFDPNNPNFGEKTAPSWVPVVFRDWLGQEILRTYADEFGKFNGRLPSTFSVNLPYATGVSPNMLTSCMNDSNPVPNPAYNPLDPMSQPYITDPYYNPKFSTFCYTFQYMPGSTTYLDTPVIPVAAFANSPVDCEFPTATPVIYSVTTPAGGPFISDAVGGNRQLTITSMGTAVPVVNPDYNPAVAGSPQTIVRDFSFGAARGAVKIGNRTLQVVSWNATTIVANVPAGVLAGQLTVRTAGGKETEIGVHVSIFDETALGAPVIRRVSPSAVPNATPIQDQIDLANPGDLILIAPGLYTELVIMHKPVQLQGYGAMSSGINASNVAGTKLIDWRAKLNALYTTLSYDLLPGQTQPILNLEEGAGITVLANVGEFAGVAARIDGLSVKSAVQGGGIMVNGHATGLQLSNNQVTGNQGNFGGGIRIGHPAMTFVNGAQTLHTDADNDGIVIHHNKVTQNGGGSVGAGGGIALYTGADNYSVDHNFVCGNFTTGNGGGIGHFGLSNNGSITNNKIVFNQSFRQLGNVHGGGIALLGKAPFQGNPEGTGSVTVEGNLIQGNQSGAGHGGGIYAFQINGADLVAPAVPNKLNVTDNVIVNNIAGWAGGGIALQDVANSSINNNTIANNDSTATVGAAANPANLNATLPQPGAGIVSFNHTGVLAGLSGQAYSNPELVNNIIWHNRMFHVQVTTIAGPPVVQTVRLIPDLGTAGALPVYSDLAVTGAAGTLNPMNSVLTNTTGYDLSNLAVDPGFIFGYQNGALGSTPIQGEGLTAPNIAGAFDEGGNFIDLRFSPVTIYGSNYHLGATSPAINAGAAVTSPLLAKDYDGNNRPTGAGVDIGADEVVADSDGDGVYNDMDNCINHANAHQFDANDDGYGNRCDADLNNIGPVVNTADYLVFRSVFGAINADADFNNSGGPVNTADYLIFRQLFGFAPGPSAFAP